MEYFYYHSCKQGPGPACSLILKEIFSYYRSCKAGNDSRYCTGKSGIITCTPVYCEPSLNSTYYACHNTGRASKEKTCTHRCSISNISNRTANINSKLCCKYRHKAIGSTYYQLFCRIWKFTKSRIFLQKSKYYGQKNRQGCHYN